MKYLFDLPSHTPTPAILFSFGLLYTAHRVDKKRLIYLHRVLKRHDQHWVKRMLMELDKLNTGWAKDIRETLRAYDLPEDYDEIKAYTRRMWIRTVTEKIEVKNTQRLLNDCHKTVDGVLTPKTKTAHIVEELNSDSYTRKAREDILQSTKHEAKTLLMARFGMLECGRNYKGSIRETCTTCNEEDTENHRLNYCPKFSSTNNHESKEKFCFDGIYSSDASTFRKAIEEINKVWNTRSAHGTMRT